MKFLRNFMGCWCLQSKIAGCWGVGSESMTHELARVAIEVKG